MYKVVIEKKIFLPKNNNPIAIDCSLSSFRNPEECDTELLTNIYVNQILSGLNNAISKFNESEIPDYFINGQDFVISNDYFLYEHHGIYDSYTDSIFFNADSINGIRRVDPAHLLAHELGHKIIKYRDVNEAFNNLADMFGVSRDYEDLLNELYADICGNIVTNSREIQTLDSEIIDDEFYNDLNSVVLRSIYKC